MSELRQEIDRLIASGDAAAAARFLADLWRMEESSSTASFLVSRYEQLRGRLGLLPYRLAILRSFTVEPMVPLLRAAAFVAGIDLSVQLSAFNAYVQEMIDPASVLYGFRPDAVVLAVQTRDIAPELWRDGSALTAEQSATIASRVTADFRSWVKAFRQHSNTHLILHNLEQPEFPNQGILDTQSKIGQTSSIQTINDELRGLVREHAGVYILDYDALLARYGRRSWHDERKWLTVRLPIAAPYLGKLVKEWMRFLHPLTGKTAKALVVDLDNTLWGGIIGEDGMNGIRLSTEYPGAAFQEFQRALLDLHRRGVLLGICSKNNQDDAMEVFQQHPGMLLKPSHFSATRINWGDKAQNLREIAAELNIGRDTLAFADDNPIERQQVRSQVPEVWVLDLPADPMEYARTIRECPLFERLTLSTEDQQRGEYYQAQRQREQLEQAVTSREDFYRSLQQEVEIAPLTKSTLQRMAQLTNKTNQFNLTTRRYTEQQMAELSTADGWNCFSLRVRDHYGDNGLVGVAITRHMDKICEVDTLLMSCRVIGRTVETAFLAFLAEHASRQGAEHLQGWFLPTKKNSPARDFYSDHGFQVIEQKESGTLWGLDLGRKSIASPDWIRLHIVNEGRGEKE